MRAATLAVVCSLVLFGISADAQMRGGGHFASGGSRGAVRSGPGTAVRGMSGAHSVRPFFPTASIGNGTSNSNFIHTADPFAFRGFPDFNDRFFFNPFVIHSNSITNPFPFGFGNGHHGHDGFFGFGGFPFAGGFGFGGWPYYTDYSAFNYDQNQQFAQAQLAENERLFQQMQDDRQRQMELDQQLADQRAADALAARTQPPVPPRPASNATERVTPPTVLVYRDQHQVEIGSYAITASTIYEIAPHYTRKIQLSELDIPATIAANEQRGVQFSVPGKAK